MTHYETLGLEPGATADQIRGAFRKAAKDAHPDREGGDHERMQAVNAAYAVLSDPDKRAEYDSRERVMAERQLEAAFAEALDGLAVNPVASVRRAVVFQANHLDTEERKKGVELESIARQRGRVKRRGPGVNVFARLLDKRESTARAALEQIAEAKRVVALVSLMLNDYDGPADYASTPAAQGYNEAAALALAGYAQQNRNRSAL